MANKFHYGLMEYLECCLSNLYSSESNNHNEIKLIKNRISNIRNKILEGVKIR